MSNPTLREARILQAILLIVLALAIAAAVLTGRVASSDGPGAERVDSGAPVERSEADIAERR